MLRSLNSCHRGMKTMFSEDCDDRSTVTLRDEPSGIWQSGI